MCQVYGWFGEGSCRLQRSLAATQWEAAAAPATVSATVHTVTFDPVKSEPLNSSDACCDLELPGE